MSEHRKINVRALKTEGDWGDILDEFWIAATPKFFEWLRWAMTLAVITYVAHLSNSIAPKVVLGVCYVSLLLYYQTFFNQFDFENFPSLKSQKAHRIASIILSGLLSFGTLNIVIMSVDAQK